MEYIILGNGFIKSFPSYSFVKQSGALGLHLPEDMQILSQTLDESFCLSLCSDGIDHSVDLYNLYEGSSALELATGIYNNYALDDDASVIVIKKDSFESE